MSATRIQTSTSFRPPKIRLHRNFAPVRFFFYFDLFFFCRLWFLFFCIIYPVSSHSASSIGYCFPFCRLYSLERLIALSLLDFELPSLWGSLFFACYGFVCSLPSWWRPGWVQCLHHWWFYSCAPNGQNWRFEDLVARFTKLILDYLNVQAVHRPWMASICLCRRWSHCRAPDGSITWALYPCGLNVFLVVGFFLCHTLGGYWRFCYPLGVSCMVQFTIVLTLSFFVSSVFLFLLYSFML